MNTLKERQDRDQYIIADYMAGTEIAELSRTYGVSTRRITQILNIFNVKLRPKKPIYERDPISAVHEKIGRRMIDHRFENDLQPNDVATDLGWNFRKLSSVEQGHKELELLDLIDLATYLKTDVTDLIKNGK